MSLQAFCAWLAATPASQFLQTTEWIIPAVQTVHILCIAVVISAVLLVHLHTLGLAMRTHSSALLAARFLPGLWWALILLLLSGSILIVAEPERSLPNYMFQVKMSLLIVAITLTVLYQVPLRKDPTYWEKTPARRTNSLAIAIVSLLAWVGIVFAGRWIAYAIA
jgi:hypothetical protein